MTSAGIDLLFYALGMEFGYAYTGWQRWTVGTDPALTYGAWRARWQEQETIADLLRDGMLEEVTAFPGRYLHYAVTEKGKAFMQNWWACPQLSPSDRKYEEDTMSNISQDATALDELRALDRLLRTSAPEREPWTGSRNGRIIRDVELWKMLTILTRAIAKSEREQARED